MTIATSSPGTERAGTQVTHDVAEKIRRLKAPDEITMEPILISALGATAELDRSGFFQHTLCLTDLVQ